MKLCLVGIMLCASFSALSQERSINDLMYLPEAKTFYTKLAYDKNTENGEINAATDADYRQDRDLVTLDLGYSTHDNLSFELSLGYRSDMSLTEPDGSSEIETRTKGMTNPTARFKWRALDQKNDDVIVDIIPYISVKTGTTRDATATSDGNGVTGNGYGVEGNIGKKLESSQYMGIIKINHVMRNESNATSYDPQTRYEIGGVYQKSLAKSLFGNFSLSRIHWDDYRNDDINTANYERFSASDAWSLGVEAQITPAKNLLLSIGYKHYLLADYSSKDQSGSKTKYEDLKARTLSMFARYQF